MLSDKYRILKKFHEIDSTNWNTKGCVVNESMSDFENKIE